MIFFFPIMIIFSIFNYSNYVCISEFTYVIPLEIKNLIKDHLINYIQSDYINYLVSTKKIVIPDKNTLILAVNDFVVNLDKIVLKPNDRFFLFIIEDHFNVYLFEKFKPTSSFSFSDIFTPFLSLYFVKFKFYDPLALIIYEKKLDYINILNYIKDYLLDLILYWIWPF